MRDRRRRPGATTAARGLAAGALVGLFAAGAWAWAAPAAPAAPAGVLVLDDFEAAAWPDPALWLPGDAAAGQWWPSGCRARTGSRALWAFGRRADGVARVCGEAVAGGTSSVIGQRLDLRGARATSRLELQFDVWMQLPAGAGGAQGGLFIFLVVPTDGGGARRVPVFGATGVPGDWVFPARQLDLLNLADITNPRQVFDLRGGEWRLEWQAITGAATAPGGGVFVDDVRLVWEPEAAFPTPTRGAVATATASASTTPTPSPTAPASATATATARSSATPTATGVAATPTASRTATVPPEATPTAGATAVRAWLPLAFWELPPPTETPSPTPEASPTAAAPGTPPVETATPTATRRRSSGRAGRPCREAGAAGGRRSIRRRRATLPAGGHGDIVVAVRNLPP